MGIPSGVPRTWCPEMKALARCYMGKRSGYAVVSAKISIDVMLIRL
jgi:hypothetical protein